MKTENVDQTIKNAFEKVKVSNIMACVYLNYVVILAPLKIVSSLLIASAALATSPFKSEPFSETFENYKITIYEKTQPFIRPVAKTLVLMSAFTVGILAIPLFGGIYGSARAIQCIEARTTSTEFGVSLLEYLGDENRWPLFERIDNFF